MPRSKGRGGRPWRRISKAVLAQSTVCWICGYEIDMNLPATDPMSATVDHVHPLSKGGDPLDPAGLRPAHRRCNSRRGTASYPRTAGTSRRW